MANLRTEFLGKELKNPVGVASCDFGATVELAERVIDQGIGFLTTKTIHDINGPHRWPRPYFYSLKKFGHDLKDVWVCSQMFDTTPSAEWFETEGPKIVKLCKENDVFLIGSVGAADKVEDWVNLCIEMERIGVDAVELDTGGPHATFGAVPEEVECGAPLAMDPVKTHELSKACSEAVKIPVLYKCTPQAVNQAQIAMAIKEGGAAGLTANNSLYGTWIDHETGTFYGGPYAVGGLIGRPWQIFSLAKLLESTATVKGFPTVGVGGIFTWDDCIRYIMAGSNVVALCSAVYSKGVGVLKDCIDGMSQFMDRKGYKSISEFKGCVVDDFSYVRDWPREQRMAKISPIIPKFDYEKCTQCGTCEKLCPYGAITMKTEGPVINDSCMGCGWCMGHCPSEPDTILMVRRDNGKVVWNGRGTHEAWVND